MQRLRVQSGSAADGITIDDLAAQLGDIWVGIVVRHGQLLPVQADTALQDGDDIVVLANLGLHPGLTAMFKPHPLK